MKRQFAAAAAAALVALAVPAAASAAPATHGRHVAVKVTWRHHHRTEIVRVTSNPHHIRVVATGVCAKPFTAHHGRILHGRGVTRVHCPSHWKSAGYFTGWQKTLRYHHERGSRNWLTG